MAVCLYRDDDDAIEMNALSWTKLQELAELHGWNGFHSSRIFTGFLTNSGEWVDSHPRLALVSDDGDSVLTDGEFVSGQDALALAVALERALPNLPAEKRKLPNEEEIEFPDGSRISGIRLPRPEPRRSDESEGACRARVVHQIQEFERSIRPLDYFSGKEAVNRVAKVIEFMKRGSFAIE